MRPTEDTSDTNFDTLPSVIYHTDRRHFRLEVKLSTICHLSGRQKTLPTRSYIPCHLSFIRPTEDTSDSKLNYLPFVIYQADRRHFRLEIKFLAIWHLSGRQKTLPTWNWDPCHQSFIRLTEDDSDSKLNSLPSIIYQADRRHYRLEVKFIAICHLSGRQKTLPTPRN